MTREPHPIPPPAVETAPSEAADQAAAWFAKLRASGAPAADRAAFEAWRAADPAHAAAFAAVEALWASPELTAAIARNARTSMGTHPARMSGDLRAALRSSRWLRAAAACAAVLLLAVGLGAAFDLPTRLAADAMTAVGERRMLTLADGSTVTLNSGSAVALDDSGGRRGVRLLAGEAFFEVTPDPARPFEVRAGDALVRVLGTAFSVRRVGDSVYVAVASGVVQVSAREGGAVRLGSNDTARAGPDGVESRGQVPVADILAWRDGRFVFRDRPLGNVLASLERYQRGWIVVADERLAALPVSGNYKLDDPAAIVDALAQATGARVTRVTGRLTVLR